MTLAHTTEHSATALASAANPALDLDAYFERIGYAGPRAPTLDTLRGLVFQHTSSIAFENLNPLLRWPVQLDLASLQQKLVRDGRGGYCFEQNLLFSQVLQALGFEVRQLVARVLWGRSDYRQSPRSHMLLRVDLDGQPYLLDVGFGGLTLTGVLRLAPDVEQATPHEPFRLKPDGDALLMQALVKDEWRSLYRFDLQEQLLVDYEVTNWYISNHPSSHFLHNLIAARPDANRRYALFNTELSIHQLNGESERRTLSSVAELRLALEQLFYLALPQGPELDAALQGVLERAAGRPA